MLHIIYIFIKYTVGVSAVRQFFGWNVFEHHKIIFTYVYSVWNIPRKASCFALKWHWFHWFKFRSLNLFSIQSSHSEWQRLCRASELWARSALILLPCSLKSMSVNQTLASTHIGNKFRILRKQLWLGCCENWFPGWRAWRIHSSRAGGVLPWEAITAECQLTASFQSESGLAWSSGTL